MSVLPLIACATPDDEGHEPNDASDAALATNGDVQADWFSRTGDVINVSSMWLHALKHTPQTLGPKASANISMTTAEFAVVASMPAGIELTFTPECPQTWKTGDTNTARTASFGGPFTSLRNPGCRITIRNTTARALPLYVSKYELLDAWYDRAARAQRTHFEDRAINPGATVYITYDEKPSRAVLIHQLTQAGRNATAQIGYAFSAGCTAASQAQAVVALGWRVQFSSPSDSCTVSVTNRGTSRQAVRVSFYE